MIYLASPYTHPDAVVREQRYHETCRATAEMLLEGETVFCPIVHCHPLVAYGVPTEWTFWEEHDRQYLVRCEELVVLKLDGWRRSRGVQAEIKLAAAMDMPIRYNESRLE